MIQPEGTEQEKSFEQKPPRLGRVSQLVLIVGIFVILVIPLAIVYLQQPAMQAQLQAELVSLESRLAALETEITDKDKLERNLSQAEAQLEAAREAYPDPDQSPEIIDCLLGLAESNDIDVTKTKVSIPEEDEEADEGTSQYPLLTFEIALEGQVPKFQNFLLALDAALPTAEVKDVTFTIAEEEDEEDMASITIDVSCYEGSD